MFGFFKKKGSKDQYLLRVSAILHKNIGPTLPLENAYNLAKECLIELRERISNGMFHDGPNPKENIMAYYSMCSMISETNSSDDKITVLKLSVMANVLKDELGTLENMTSLEKGILQFGEHILAGGLSAPSDGEIAKIKSNAAQIIMELMKDQEAIVSEHDVKMLVENVSAHVGDREVSKVGERVLAVSALSNVTGYHIDQGENDIAYSYFMCIGAAVRKYFEGNLEPYSEYQKSALLAIMQDYRSLGEELITDHLSFDSDLDTTNKKQEAAQTGSFRNSKGQVTPITGRKIEPESRSLDGPEFREKLKEFYSKLYEISERPSEKSCKMSVMPCDGSYWSWDFKFSEEEEALAYEVVNTLHDQTQGWIIASTFPIRKNSVQNKSTDDTPF